MAGTRIREPDHAHLDDQLCFALYAASRAVMGAYRQRLSELGLTYPQYLAMLAVWENDGSTLTELGRALDLDSGTLSPLVRRLVELGYLTKARTGPDERTVFVRTTDAGRRLERQVADVRTHVESATGLSSAEFRQLRSRLHTLRNTVKPPPE